MIRWWYRLIVHAEASIDFFFRVNLVDCILVDDFLSPIREYYPLRLHAWIITKEMTLHHCIHFPISWFEQPLAGEGKRVKSVFEHATSLFTVFNSILDDDCSLQSFLFNMPRLSPPPLAVRPVGRRSSERRVPISNKFRQFLLRVCTPLSDYTSPNPMTRTLVTGPITKSVMGNPPGTFLSWAVSRRRRSLEVELRRERRMGLMTKCAVEYDNGWHCLLGHRAHDSYPPAVY